MRKGLAWTVLSLMPGLVAACGGGQLKGKLSSDAEQNDAERVRPRSPIRCPQSHKTRYFDAYDTSGDDRPDVRRYVRKAKDGRAIPVCREADLDGDGIYDIFVMYGQEGRPQREVADRDFDGKIDRRAYYQTGELVWQELDGNGDGSLETRIFFEGGIPMRSERDLGGRSTTKSWKPDTWEYYEEGRLIRVGRDTDGDGVVDTWERSRALSESFQS